MENHFIDFLKYLKVQKNYSNLTILNYGKDLKLFNIFISDLNIKDLKKVDYKIIREYLSYLYGKNYSKKTIARHISALRSFYRYLIKEKIITSNPMNLVSNPKQDKKLPKFLYYDQVEELLSIPDITTPLGLRDKTILEILYSTGIRVSELVNIKLKDIDLNERTIKILGKGNKERYVLYGSVLEKLLEGYLNESRSILNKKNSDYLLLNNQGNKITSRGIELIINKIAKESSLDFNISPHTLRHTFATHLLDNGADLKSVQELLGHESLSSTQVYTHISNEQLRNVYLHTHPRAKQ